MTISEVASRLDISVDTLRYYEKIGLIPSVERDRHGNRSYSEANCHWIEFIKCMRRAGLSLDALKEYVSLLEDGEGTIARRKEILLEQKAGLQDQLQMIQETIGYLDYKIEGYEERMIPFEKELIAENILEEEDLGA